MALCRLRQPSRVRRPEFHPSNRHGRPGFVLPNGIEPPIAGALRQMTAAPARKGEVTQSLVATLPIASRSSLALRSHICFYFVLAANPRFCKANPCFVRARAVSMHPARSHRQLHEILHALDRAPGSKIGTAHGYHRRIQICSGCPRELNPLRGCALDHGFAHTRRAACVPFVVPRLRRLRRLRRTPCQCGSKPIARARSRPRSVGRSIFLRDPRTTRP
jgi:hypothetical protein